MMRNSVRIGLTLVLLPAAGAAGQGWMSFVNETDTRLQSDPAVGVSDDREKDYIVGDIDNDGDDDLICVRKEPFTSTGRNTNVLFMNENGVLIDRTATYAIDSDVPGDLGFLTATNDRDVTMADVNGDGWLDVITAVTLTDNAEKHLSHPRIYMNLGESNGVWQGLRYEDARIPQMHATAGPRFCSVAAGDIDGDGDEDLYFGDYDSGGSQIFDYNNRLLINDGSGYFTDETASRLTSEMSEAAFGAASVIADMNGDGALDIVKQTSLNAPQHIAVTWNSSSNEGVFVGYQIVDQLAPYHVSVGDLNGDGMLDMITSDDGVDNYYLNQGNDSNGYAQFAQRAFDAVTGGFGSDNYCVDLDNDGNLDVIICDVDVDISGCSRTTHLLRNRGESPDVTFSRDDTGIPDSMLEGVHDIAVIDINGDGWVDLVIGRCESTEVWMNEPPTGMTFGWDGGIPSQVSPGMPHEVQFTLNPIGGAEIAAGSGALWGRVGGGAWSSIPVTPLGGETYSGDLPAVECAEELEFYASGELLGGSEYADPSSAPAAGYVAVGADGVETLIRLDFEEPAVGWTVENDPSLSTGAWEQVDPLGTLFGTVVSQPENDATAGADAILCFITQNGSVGGSVGEADVDGGPTRLISPAIDLDATDGTISYARYFFDSDSGDSLVTEISGDDGGTWVMVHETEGTNSAWDTTSFRVGDYIIPTAAVRVRWLVEDANTASVVEAGIDNIQLDVFVCDDTEPCLGDIDGNGEVSVDDVLVILGSFGDSTTGPADLNGDGIVNIDDMLIILSAWGPCA
jgi:hypothetical protein